ncbi:MAG: class I SAM-dependent methyltransferase [Patescibacteria group bacterium]
MKRWERYHHQVGENPNSLVVHTLSDFVTRRESSLDLGAGNLRDSKFLKNQGFTRLVAVDNSDESLEFATEGIELHISPIEIWKPEKDTFDFAFSCNTLFFLDRLQVGEVFRNVLAGLRSGGIFACNVLGEEDGWVAQGKQVSWFNEKQVIELCVGFEVLGISESKKNSFTLNELGYSIPKLWHQISIVAQKP